MSGGTASQPSTATAGRLSRDVLIYASGDVATRALGFISVPIYTHLFLPPEYSLLAFASTIAILVSGLSIVGGDTVLARFWFERDEDARRSLATTWIGFLAVVSLVMTGAALLTVPIYGDSLLESDDGALVLGLALATVPLANVSRMLAQILRNQFRPVAFALTSFTFGVIALPVGLLLVLVGDAGIAGILGGLVIAELIVLVVRVLLVRRTVFGQVDLEVLRKLVRFGVPLIPVTVSFWAFSASDRIILAKLGSFKELGYYSAALSLIAIFSVFSAAVGQAWAPRLYALHARDPQAAGFALARSLTYFMAAVGGLAVLLGAFASEVIAVLTSDAYAPAAEVVPLLAAGAVAFGTSVITSMGMTLTNRTTHLLALSLIAAAINVGLAVTLVPRLGMMGAALSSLIGYTTLTSLYLLGSQRAWPIQLERRRLLTLAIVLLASEAIATALFDARIDVRLLIPVSASAIAVLVAGIDDYDRTLVFGLLRLLKRKKHHAKG